jgi:hypothetical protein
MTFLFQVGQRDDPENDVSKRSGPVFRGLLTRLDWTALYTEVRTLRLIASLPLSVPNKYKLKYTKL